MNRVILCGRLTKDPDVRYSQTGQNQTEIAKYTLAVERRFKNAEGKYDADFISCVAFGKSGEFAEKYLRKGMKILIVGRIQTGSYTNNDGQKIYTTDVVVEEHEFVGSKGSDDKPTPTPVNFNGFMNLPDGIAEELPFN